MVVVDEGPVDDLADDLADAVERWTGNRGHVQVLTATDHRRLLDDAPPLLASGQRELQPIIGKGRSLLGSQAPA